MSCYTKSNDSWIGIDVKDAAECTSKGNKWVDSPSTLSVNDPSTCNTIAMSTFINCANRSFSDTYKNIKDWSLGAGTKISNPPNPEEDINPEDNWKRVKNIATKNKRHVYIGVYLTLITIIIIMLIRMI